MKKILSIIATFKDLYPKLNINYYFSEDWKGKLTAAWLGNKFLLIVIFFLPQLTYAYTWSDLWWRADQQGAYSLQQGDVKTAAQQFIDKQWRGVANYRAQNYKNAVDNFAKSDTPLANYNRGNALAHSGDFAEAIKAYEKAIAQQPGFADAIYNRDLLKKLQDQKQQQQKQNQQSKQQKQQQGDNSKNNNQQQENQQQNKQNKNNKQGQQAPDNKKSENNPEQNKPDTQQQQQNQQQSPANDQNKQNQQQQSQDQQQKSKQNKEQNQQQSQDKQKTQDQQQNSQQQNMDDNPQTMPRNENKNKQSQKSNEEQKLQQNLDDQQKQKATEGQAQEKIKPQDQQTQKWLQQIPDDPGGLLQRKFLRDHMRHQEQQSGDMLNEIN